MAILKKNAETLDIDISDEIFIYIASNIKSNVRELEGALHRIYLQYNNDRRKQGNDLPLTLNLVEGYIKDLIKPDTKREVTLDTIINVVAREYNVTYDEITSKSRNAEYVMPRQVVMYLSRRLLDISLDDIAKALGKKDHTTIIHGIKKIETDIKSKKDFKEKVDNLLNKITQN